jgi:hypothetical protein
MAIDDDVFLLDEKAGLTRMEESPYDREDVLQVLLEQHPVLIAGTLGVDRDPALALVKREASVPDRDDSTGRWSVDHLFVDADAVPMLVEVKRSTDTRIRREMIGQMLDYAANAVSFWSADGLQADFEATCVATGQDPEEALEELLGTDEQAAGFWQKVQLNLQAGRIRMVFVADVIPFEVQRVVEFLNDQMSPAEVLAIEVRQYLGSNPGVKTIVPRVLGQTTKARQRKNPGTTAPSRDWDEGSVLAEIRQQTGGAAQDVARRLLRWARDRDLQVGIGGGPKSGRASIDLPVGDGSVRIGSFSSEGRYYLQFNSLRDVPAFDDDATLDALIQRYERVDGIRVPRARRRKKPTFDLAILSDGGQFDVFCEALEHHLGAVAGGSS